MSTCPRTRGSLPRLKHAVFVFIAEVYLIPDSWSIPLDQLEAQRFTLPMNRRLVAMSRTGERSADATVELREMGFQAVNFDGGLEAWAAGGGAIVTDDGGPGRLA